MSELEKNENRRHMFKIFVLVIFSCILSLRASDKISASDMMSPALILYISCHLVLYDPQFKQPSSQRRCNQVYYEIKVEDGLWMESFIWHITHRRFFTMRLK